MDKEMTRRAGRWILAGVVLLPGCLRAQTEPGATPSSNAAQQQQAGSVASQGTPGATRANGGAYAQDSSLNGGVESDVQEMKDKIFLRKAMLGGRAEVQMGELAAQKGASEDVKRFGQQMVTDHTSLNDSLKGIAAGMNMQPPKKLSKEDQAEYDKLSGMSGAEFDKEYLAYMTADHVRDLKDFHEEADAAHDATVKEAARQGEHVIARHTRMLGRLDAEAGIAVPTAKQP